eukprot:1176410-Prorocentrum_minimum.AAC.2
MRPVFFSTFPRSSSSNCSSAAHAGSRSHFGRAGSALDDRARHPGFSSGSCLSGGWQHKRERRVRGLWSTQVKHKALPWTTAPATRASAPAPDCLEDGNTRGSQRPVVFTSETERESQRPMVNTREGERPMVNTRESERPMVNTSESERPMVNTSQSERPMVNIWSGLSRYGEPRPPWQSERVPGSGRYRLWATEGRACSNTRVGAGFSRDRSFVDPTKPTVARRAHSTDWIVAHIWTFGWTFGHVRRR